MDKNFREIGVSDQIIEAIELMGFKDPTDVQFEAIPYILNRTDCIVLAKTGSGKTGAFGIPLLQCISPELKKVQGLILTPTRELAVQVDQELTKMSKFLGLKTAVVYGQHNINTEIEDLQRGAVIVTGTPGRVLDHIERKSLKTKELDFLVLDEADRMLDMGFFAQVMEIIQTLPKDRTTLLFSATMPPEIQRLCKKYMQNPVILELSDEVKTVDTISQVYYRVDPKEKRSQLNRLLKTEQPDSCIVFCNTRSEVDVVERYLKDKGYAIAALHGGNSQTNRMDTLHKIKNKKLQVIVATDVAARGIHIDDLSLVINYDVPQDKNNYIHRIGRTARVGNTGKAISLVTSEDLMTLYEIEEHVGVMIEEKALPTDDFVKECVNTSTNRWIHYIPEPEPQNKPRSAENSRPKKGHTRKTTEVKKYSDQPQKNATTPAPSRHPKFNEKTNSPEKRNVTEGQYIPEKPKIKEHETVVFKPNEPSIPAKPIEIDYRAEAKKLIAKAKEQQKETSGIKKFFRHLLGKD